MDTIKAGNLMYMYMYCTYYMHGLRGNPSEKIKCSIFFSFIIMYM